MYIVYFITLLLLYKTSVLILHDINGEKSHNLQTTEKYQELKCAFIYHVKN